MQVSVKEVSAGSPADGELQPGDVIVSHRRREDRLGTDKLLGLIRGKPVGTTLTIDLLRAGQPLTVQVTTVAGDNNTPRVGFQPELVSTAPFTVDIPIEGIGGPSAGLMLALGIIDKIKPEDLTGGNIIAGTGTIDNDGKVGPIGGVPQKLVAAKAAGAKIFLTPSRTAPRPSPTPSRGCCWSRSSRSMPHWPRWTRCARAAAHAVHGAPRNLTAAVITRDHFRANVRPARAGTLRFSH